MAHPSRFDLLHAAAAGRPAGGRTSLSSSKAENYAKVSHIVQRDKEDDFRKARTK